VSPSLPRRPHFCRDALPHSKFPSCVDCHCASLAAAAQNTSRDRSARVAVGFLIVAAALASYAKQADDEQLLNNAKRIKARAIDRIGELASEIPPQPGKRTDLQPNGGAPSRLEDLINHVFDFHVRGRAQLSCMCVPRHNSDAAQQGEPFRFSAVALATMEKED
jgi:hypothetical protein